MREMPDIDQPDPHPERGALARRLARFNKAPAGAVGGLIIGVLLTTGAGAAYLDSFERDVRRELQVEIDAQIEQFLALAGKVVTLYGELSRYVVLKAADAMFVGVDSEGRLVIDWDGFRDEIVTTKVADNIERRILLLETLGKTVAGGVREDIDEASDPRDATFDISPDRILSALLVQFPEDARLAELRRRCDDLRAEVDTLRDASHWLRRSLDVIRRAVGLPQLFPNDPPPTGPGRPGEGGN